MADVFVSYARGDQRLAQRVAKQLSDAGFSVWWDTELLPHNRFATEIEDQIRAAHAVLVIWSQASTASSWVRAEAELGRAEGKLIQLSIDDCTIPIPFNQYQSADVRGWHGNEDDPQWRKVLASVAQLANFTAKSPPARTPRRAVLRRLWFALGYNRLGLASLIVVALTGGVLFFWSSHAVPVRGARIAVQPFRTIDGSAALSEFAAGLSNSLQDELNQDQLQTLSSTEAETLRGENLASHARALGVGLMFSGNVAPKGPNIDVEMRLDDPVQHATLWTAQISGPAAQSDQLQARVDALTLAVLDCTAQALAPNVRIPDPALQAFLHACELSQTASHGLMGGRAAYAMLDAMRQAASEAPDFAAAHSVLAKHLAFVAAYHLLDNVGPIRQEAANEANRALELDSKDPDGFVAFGLLAPPLDFARRENLFRRALASNPSWPHANGFLGNVMTDTGRLQEAATLYQRAASVNQHSNDWAIEAAGGLIRVGETQEADRELAKLYQIWPMDAENIEYQLQSFIAQKRWSEANELLNRASDFPQDFSPSWIADWRRLFAALNSNNPAAREAVHKALIDSATSNPQHAMYGLALLGFIDDSFSVGMHQMPVDPSREDAAGFIFDPEVASLRRDPRFMALAARFGLLDYWRRTGNWPDFCRDPELPFSCIDEAAKIALNHR